MITRSNLHTHCTFCDGKNSMAEMAQSALLGGLTGLGFSSHCHSGYKDDVCQIKKDQVDLYFNELENLKQQYAGRLEIFKGMELESKIKGEVRPKIDPRCDYSIGSCHLARINGRRISLDHNHQDFQEALNNYKSIEKLVESYFEEYLGFAKEVSFDIVGHIDIYSKMNEDRRYFDPDAKWYKDLVIPFIDEICKTDKIFEINTGAMAKGYRKAPYPETFILKRLLENKARILISSDSHKAETITYAFEETEKMLIQMGFKYIQNLTSKGFESLCLETQ